MELQHKFDEDVSTERFFEVAKEEVERLTKENTKEKTPMTMDVSKHSII